MRRGLGTGFLFAVAITMAMSSGISGPGSRRSPATAPASSGDSSSPLAQPQEHFKVACDLVDVEQGSACKPCAGWCPTEDLQATITDFFLPSGTRDESEPPLPPCPAKGNGDAAKESSTAFDEPFQETDQRLQEHWGVPRGPRGRVQFVVAIVPDPAHTHLDLLFDRQIDAIEQGIHQEGYLFARSYMPWDSKKYAESTDIRTRLLQDNYQSAREQLPGLMIFHDALHKEDP